MLLSKMRSGIFSYLFLGFLLFAGLGLVLTDWTGSYSHGGGSTHVAVVGGERISAAEFDRTARRVARAQNLDTQTAYQAGIFDEVLQMQVMDILMQKAAFDSGIVVADRHVANQVNAMLEPMAGKNMDKKDVLQRVLQSQNMSEAELVHNLRTTTARGVLRDAVAGNLYIPAVLAQDLYGYQHETRSAEAVFIGQESFRPKDPDAATLAAYFKTVQDQYSEPESRSFTVAFIDPEKLVKDTPLTDKDLRDFYDQNTDSFEKPEQRSLEQAVVGTKDKADAIVKAAKGGTLQDAVKTATGDTKAYSAEASFGKDGLPEQMADPVFKSAEGDVVGPIQSPLGWHVIKVKKIQPASVEPFEQVKDSIAKELSHDRRADAIFAATTALEDRMSSGESLDEIAKETPLTMVEVKNARLGMKEVAALKNYKDDEEAILQSAFKLKEGETSPLNDPGHGHMFVVRLDTVISKRVKDLDEVKQDVTARWKIEQGRKNAAAYAAQKMQQLEKGETTLAAIAKERNSKVQNFTGLMRAAKSAPAGLSEGNVQQIMAAEKGKPIVMPSDKGLMLATVTSVKSAGGKPSESDLGATREALTQEISQENLLSLVDALQADYKTETNPALLERMYAGTAEEGQ